MWVSAALGLVQLWILFSPDPKLIIWPDSIGYLGPAADALELGYFSHWYGRGFGYSAWLWTWLRLTPEPWIIIVVQRFSVVATFLCLASSIVVLSRQVTLRRPDSRGIVTACAGFWLLTYVLHQPTAGLAHAVMPETLFGLVLAAVLGGAVTLTLPNLPERWALAMTGLTVLASSALPLVKPHWLLAACVLPLALLFMAPKGRRWLLACGALAGVVLSVLVFGVIELRLQERYDPYTSRVFGPRTLFCNSSDLIYEYLSDHAADPLSLQVKEALGRILTPEARNAASAWSLLGFDGDACMYGEAAHVVTRHFGQQASPEAAFYLTTYMQALVKHPTYLPVRLARQFSALASRPFSGVAGDYFVSADDRVLAAHRDLRRLFQRWLEQHQALFSGVVELPTRRWLLVSRVFFASAGLLLSALTLVAVLLTVVTWQRPPDRTVAMTFRGVLMCALATNVLIATSHTFDPRYLVMQTPMFSLLGFAATLIAVGGLLERGRR